MDRRAFVLGMLGVAAGTAVMAGTVGEAQAAPMPVTKPDATAETERQEADYRPEVDGQPSGENAQYYYYRPRRVYYRRRRFYRRRYYRRRFYRRRYYRRVYYW